MKKNIIVLTITISVIILFFSAGCELFDGAPERDNINDPDNTLDYSVSMTFTNTNNSIGVNWTHDDLHAQTKYELYYGTDLDMDNADKTAFIENAMEYVIENLQYGDSYNIWLRAVDVDTDETIFIKYGVSMPEPAGVFDQDFAASGIFTLSALQSKAYDIIGIEGNGMYVGAGSDDTTSYQILFKLTPVGTFDFSFNGSGIYQEPIIPNPLNLAMLNNDLIAIKETAAVELFYYKNNIGQSSMLFNYYARASMGTDDGYMILTGQNMVSKFSVIKFDSNLVITNSNEFSLEHTDGYTMGIATGIDIKNGRIYAAGYRENAVFERIMHAVVLNQSDLSIINTLSLNADWDASNNRIQQIGTTGPMAEPKIAAGADGSIYVCGVGILSKFHENGNVIDTDGSFVMSGSNNISGNMYPADLLVQENGKIIAVAVEVDSMTSPTPVVLRSIVFRYNPDGSLDETFGSGGLVSIDNVELSGADITSEGKIILSGTDRSTSNGVVYQLR